MTENGLDKTRTDAGWHAMLGEFTGGLSPAALITAYVDWYIHLMASPDKQAELAGLAVENLN